MVFRRTGLWLAIAMVIVFWIGVGTVWSFLRTADSEIRRTIKDAVPIGFELKRLRQMTDDLIPEIQANQKVAAQLDVDVEYLEREIAQLQTGQDEARQQMQKLRDALRGDEPSYEFAGTTFSRQEVEEDLGRRLARYDDTQAQLEAKRRILDSRQRSLEAATEKIREYRQQHELLVEKTEALQAELKTVELAQQTGDFQFDHSKLKETKNLAMDLEKRIRVLQKLVADEQTVIGEIPVEVDGRSSSEKFDDYFAQP